MVLLLFNGSVQGTYGDDLPTRLIEVAFDSDPLGSPIWTDVTDDVRQFQTHRGRSQELAKFNSGTLSLTLDKRDRL